MDNFTPAGVTDNTVTVNVVETLVTFVVDAVGATEGAGLITGGEVGVAVDTATTTVVGNIYKDYNFTEEGVERIVERYNSTSEKSFQLKNDIKL